MTKISNIFPSPTMTALPSHQAFEVPETMDKANILLVDDREDKRLAMETIIADLGQNIVKASSGREALRHLLDQDFAVILLDVNMPGMDGFETALLIRQRKKSEHIPIIFVTGISDTETHVSRGYSLGAVDYILAPVVPEILRAKVSVFVDLFKKTEKIRKQSEYLRQAHDELEMRVKQRTAELAIANESLQAEIIERKRAEDNIRQLNMELEQRVLDRTAQLGAANRELETFTYSIAHDLRAPLRHIHGYARILDEEYASNISPEGQHYLKRIREKGESSEQMVEDLLKLFVIAKEELKFQEVDLTLLVHEAIASLNAETSERDIEWKVGKLPIVKCNARLMGQVFDNLLSNAVKYTGPRHKAVIEVGQSVTDSKSIIFVRDNGVGFNMEYVDKLFGVFQRLHPADRFPGTGIGLALTAKIIQKHQGKIWAEGKVDHGATFYFTLG